MPSYDYFCEANGQTIEVRHKMSELIKTWSQLCDHAGINTGDTASDAPVQKLANGGQVVSKSSLGSGQAPPCETTGTCCGGRMCGI